VALEMGCLCGSSLPAPGTIRNAVVTVPVQLGVGDPTRLTANEAWELSRALVSLWLEPPQLVRDIASGLDLPRPSVSSAISRLAAKNLVSTAPDPVDGRAAQQRLTRTGARLAGYR
jgi:hypothetical protein